MKTAVKNTAIAALLIGVVVVIIYFALHGGQPLPKLVVETEYLKELPYRQLTNAITNYNESEFEYIAEYKTLTYPENDNIEITAKCIQTDVLSTGGGCAINRVFARTSNGEEFFLGDFHKAVWGWSGSKLLIEEKKNNRLYEIDLAKIIAS